MNKFLLLIATLFNFQIASAAIVETKTIDDCVAIASNPTRYTNSAEVVYVFDIDNTVLALKSNFGSVQWFRWQKGLIETDSTENRVAATVDELLAAQGRIYGISSTYTPEATTRESLNHIKYQLKHPVLFHTSRSLNVRSTTERELLKHSLTASTPNWMKDFAGEFRFYYDEKSSNDVSFQKGIFMSAGQDKGVMLELLFEKLAFTPKHIVFVDDEEKNLKNVEREFAGQIPTTLCRYSAMDDVVDQFNKSDKSESIQLWKEFSELTSKL